MFGHVGVVQVLLELDGDPSATTLSGSTSLYFAAQNGHCNLIRRATATKSDFTELLVDSD